MQVAAAGILDPAAAADITVHPESEDHSSKGKVFPDVDGTASERRAGKRVLQITIEETNLKQIGTNKVRKESEEQKR